MNETPPNLDELISLYRDGALDGDRLAAFERRLAEDAELRRQVRLQSSIDDSLKRSFDPSAVAAPRIDADHAAPSTESAGRSRRLFIRFGVAAAVVLVAVIGYKGATDWFRPAGVLERLYASKVRDNFHVKWVCSDDAEFAAYTSDNLGQPLLARHDSDVTLVGWDYVPEPLDPSIGLLIAETGGRHVLVLFEPVGKAEPLTIDPRSRLSLFSRRVGDLVVYELTPLKRPHVTDLFFVPSAAERGESDKGG